MRGFLLNIHHKAIMMTKFEVFFISLIDEVSIIWCKLYGCRNSRSYLGHCHYVRNNTLGLKSPEMATSASEASLNLIGNTKPSCFFNNTVSSRQVTRGQFNDTPNSLSETRAVSRWVSLHYCSEWIVIIN